MEGMCEQNEYGQNHKTSFTFNEVFSGYQPGEVVQFFRDQHFEDHLCPRPQGC
jgi:hypothetical protein